MQWNFIILHADCNLSIVCRLSGPSVSKLRYSQGTTPGKIDQKMSLLMNILMVGKYPNSQLKD